MRFLSKIASQILVVGLVLASLTVFGKVTEIVFSDGSAFMQDSIEFLVFSAEVLTIIGAVVSVLTTILSLRFSSRLLTDFKAVINSLAGKLDE